MFNRRNPDEEFFFKYIEPIIGPIFRVLGEFLAWIFNATFGVLIDKLLGLISDFEWYIRDTLSGRRKSPKLPNPTGKPPTEAESSEAYFYLMMAHEKIAEVRKRAGKSKEFMPHLDIARDLLQINTWIKTANILDATRQLKLTDGSSYNANDLAADTCDLEAAVLKQESLVYCIHAGNNSDDRDFVDRQFKYAEQAERRALDAIRRAQMFRPNDEYRYREAIILRSIGKKKQAHKIALELVARHPGNFKYLQFRDSVA